MLLIGFIGGGLITALTIMLMCEDTVVEAMDVLDERASESSEPEPKTNSLTLEIGVGYDESDNVWKL